MKASDLIFLISFLLTGMHSIAQEQLTSREKEETITGIEQLMDSIYVFPETGAKAMALIKKQQQQGVYKNLKTPDAFAAAITNDLRKVTRDLHILVTYDPGAIEKIAKQTAGEKAGMTEAERVAMENYGFEKVELLPGNVAYVDIRFFYTPRHASETATAAMNMLANADAIIFDLRKNMGGSSQMIQLIQSYLFEQEPVHLNSFYFRPTDEHTQTWTLPYVPGKRNPGAQVYVLTSNRTFSAGEEFTYNLKNLKRATIVGETTGGGANPGKMYDVNDSFRIFIPHGRAISPVTGTNWEGTGVSPDVALPEEEALLAAQLMALEKLFQETESPEKREIYKWALKEVRAKKEGITLNAEAKRAYMGNYWGATVDLENGKLIYRVDGEDFIMTPLGNEEFALKKMPYKRLQFSAAKDTLTEHFSFGPAVTRPRQ